MKTYFLLTLILIFPAALSSAFGHEISPHIQFEGAWSEESEGLRGRLVTRIADEFGRRFPKLNNDRGSFALYLELQNTSSEMITLVLPEYYTGSGAAFQVTVHNDAGVEPKRKSIMQTYSLAVLRCVLMLSPHSSYRYEICHLTYQNDRVDILLNNGFDRPWILSEITSSAYSVAVQFAPSEYSLIRQTPAWDVEHAPGVSVWKSKLSMPAVKLPSMATFNALEEERK